MEENKSQDREELFSERVNAGKRTYFFDVKATRSNDYYVTITESKKVFKKEGEGVQFEKHKIFLYKEDFEKFTAALRKAIKFVADEAPPAEVTENQNNKEPDSVDSNSELKWD